MKAAKKKRAPEPEPTPEVRQKINVYLNREELESIRRAAVATGASMAVYMRMAALERARLHLKETT